MHTKILFTISALVLSVAVISMNTFRVCRVILEWFELIIGGIEQTVRLASRITGYTGESRMMCRYFERFRSF